MDLIVFVKSTAASHIVLTSTDETNGIARKCYENACNRNDSIFICDKIVCAQCFVLVLGTARFKFL